MGETDLEIDCACGLPGENASDVPQRQGMSSTLVPHSVSLESVQPLAGADGGKGTMSEPATKQHTLRKQSDQQTKSPGAAVCYSRSSLTPSDLDDSDFRQGSLLSSVICTETNETTPPGAGTPSSYTSRSPSLGLLDNVPYPRGVSPAVTNQCDKTVIEDTGNEAAARGDQARDPGVRAITTQNIQGGPDKNQTSKDKLNRQTYVAPSTEWEAVRPDNLLLPSLFRFVDQMGQREELLGNRQPRWAVVVVETQARMTMERTIGFHTTRLRIFLRR
ncbi:hypothetical protein AbraIFM66951_002536 [Aspergillus brasiliensis]|uniref:Uncharacterized protein n=1 Tax=Aspergillus brasiliensis TaxID=319629 RepID=A0A9W5YLU0_9EURO|nr:hypothetical protein AbraCBS73388_004788 [Aspergillus brasiliensis]GKZ49828.1 hypothetical protein AbraIFM66951_002536 [Aspergillus brasiliensis]